MKTPARPLASILLVFCLGVSVGCDARTSPRSGEPPAVVASTFEVVNVFPHDQDAFTQGLVYIDGELIESTGLHGKSTLRRVELSSGRVLRQIRVPAEYFAEGLTVLGGKIYQLTWKHQKGFVYDLATFALEKEFTYSGEGWGLTNDGRSLILSDGTHQLRFIDPVTFQVTRTVSVLRDGQPLRLLNELEFVKGEIYANIWQSQTIVRIDPANGRLIGLVDFFGLLSTADVTPATDVLNGIAYDATADRLFITGKNWPRLFEVRLAPSRP